MFVALLEAGHGTNSFLQVPPVDRRVQCFIIIGMRLFLLYFGLYILAAPSLAQQVPDLGPDATPPSVDDLHALPELDEEEGAKVVADGAAEADKLSALYDSLANAQTKSEADKIARDIQMVWLDSGSDTVDVLMKRAAVALRSDKAGLALDLLDTVVTLRPEFAEGWNRRASVFYMQEQFGKSLADIERTIALEPRHWGALSGLAIIQRRLGRDEQALETFRRALTIHPELENAKSAVEDLSSKAEGEPV